jgi:hypothetical protein
MSAKKEVETQPQQTPDEIGKQEPTQGIENTRPTTPIDQKGQIQPKEPLAKQTDNTWEILEQLKIINKNLENYGHDKIQPVTIVKTKNKMLLKQVQRAATVTIKTKLENPQIEFKNPFDRPIGIRKIEFVPDANFKLHGKIEIYLNDVLMYQNLAFGDFTDTSSDKLEEYTEQFELDGDKSVRVLLVDDGTAGNVAVSVEFASIPVFGK